MPDESALYTQMVTSGNPFSLSRLIFMILLIGLGIALLFLLIGTQIVGKENVQRFFNWSNSVQRITQGYQQEAITPDCVPATNGSEAFFGFQNQLTPIFERM